MAYKEQILVVVIVRVQGKEDDMGREGKSRGQEEEIMAHATRTKNTRQSPANNIFNKCLFIVEKTATCIFPRNRIHYNMKN